MERLGNITVGEKVTPLTPPRTHGVVLAYGLLLLICLNFLQNSGHDWQRVTELAFLFLAGCVMAYRPFASTLRDHVGSGIAHCLLIFYALGVLSSVLAFSPRYALYETASLMLLILTALVIADGLAHERSSLMRMLQGFGIGAALYATKIVSVYVSVWLLDATPSPLDFTPGFSNIRHFNHVETIGLPLLTLLYVLTPATSRLRPLYMATAAVWWTVLFVTGARGTEVSLFTAALVALLVRRRAAWPFLRAMIVTCVIGAILYELSFVVLPNLMGRLPFGDASVVARTMADPTSGRTRLWQCALDLIADHPLLGVGPLHFAHYGAVVDIGAHPHDWMLQIASEWGIPAFMALFVALVFAFRGLWRAGARVAADDAVNQNMLSAWVLIGAALLVDASVSGSIVMPQSQLMIVLYIACASAWAWSFVARRASPKQETAGSLARLATIAAAFAVAYAVAPQFIDKAIEAPPTAADVAANGTGTWWPRLWRGGYF